MLHGLSSQPRQVRRGFIQLVHVYTTRRKGLIRYRTVLTCPTPLGSDELYALLLDAAEQVRADTVLVKGTPPKLVTLLVQRMDRKLAEVKLDLTAETPRIVKLTVHSSPIARLFQEIKSSTPEGFLDFPRLDPVQPFAVIQEYPVERLFQRDKPIGAAPLLQPKPDRERRKPHLAACDRLNLLAEWAWFAKRHHKLRT